MAAASSDLVAALRRQVLDLEADLRARVDGEDAYVRQADVLDAWKRDYDKAASANRTAASWQEWRNDRVTQAAVAWVLLTVFARYCEDNTLVKPRWISGADADERTHALDSRRAYFQQNPEHTDREWLGQIIAHFAKFPATAALVDSYSPIHLVAPSGDAARALLEFWWEQNADGEPAFSFRGMDTRFLGDVYQDLSEHAKKTYALLQTPEFVEEFILDQTMEPALGDRPLEGFTVIDPTCGSGHFLLGAFHRLHERWQRHAPALGPRELVEKALDGIYGVDVNPFAVAIARFRLLAAALQAAGDTSIEQRIAYKPHLAAGDSLLWGANQQLLPEGLLASGHSVRADTTENAEALTEILQREHDVVVGNPPYITVKDAALNAMYRELYTTPHRQYALTVPFMELLFRLARPAGPSRPAGWVGQITSNSFMKREFGSKLIEKFLPTVDLRAVIDTSGAYIPGHGTPTVIIIGRRQRTGADTVRAVLGIRGEPGRPSEPADGLVWTSIVEHISDAGYENTYISVADLQRELLRGHPWSLSGGGASQLAEAIHRYVDRSLSQIAIRIGFQAMSHADEEFTRDLAWRKRHRCDESVWPRLVIGSDVRDYLTASPFVTWFPYQGSKIVTSAVAGSESLLLWSYRSTLESRATFGGETYKSSGKPWYAWHQVPADSTASHQSIAFAFVATHNHFVLDRGGKVFKQSAPVIKLPEGASVDDHLRLLGVLNSSVACFWLKQNSHNKGRPGAEQAGADEPWEHRYEFTGTTLQDFPLPKSTPFERAKILDDLAQELQRQTPEEVAARDTPTAAALSASRAEYEQLRGLMIAYQEELDWEYYQSYGLTENELTYAGDLPPVDSAERAFAILLARNLADGATETTWFKHHNHRFNPTKVIPTHLPADYQELIQRRLDAIRVQSTPPVVGAPRVQATVGS